MTDVYFISNLINTQEKIEVFSTQVVEEMERNFEKVEFYAVQNSNHLLTGFYLHLLHVELEPRNFTEMYYELEGYTYKLKRVKEYGNKEPQS